MSCKVTRLAEIKITLNDNRQTLYPEMFGVIMQQAVDDGCADLNLDFEWEDNHFSIILHDSTDQRGEDAFDEKYYDNVLPVFKAHLETMFEKYDATIMERLL